jgi:hypothetical protein
VLLWPGDAFMPASFVRDEATRRNNATLRPLSASCKLAVTQRFASGCSIRHGLLQAPRAAIQIALQNCLLMQTCPFRFVG